MAYLGNLSAWLDKIKGSFKSASVSGTTITLTKNDDTEVTLTTQDTVYTHPTTSGNKHIPSGGSSGQILRWSSDGTAEWGNELDPVYSVATTSANGLMSSTDKTKLDGISSGAEVNQNAFATVKVGTTDLVADSKTDTLTITAGSNITLTPNENGDSFTISATDTTYSVATSSANGLMSSTDKAAFDTLQTVLTGGTTGQVLAKTANGYAWSDLTALPVNPSGE